MSKLPVKLGGVGSRATLENLPEGDPPYRFGTKVVNDYDPGSLVEPYDALILGLDGLLGYWPLRVDGADLTGQMGEFVPYQGAPEFTGSYLLLPDTAGCRMEGSFPRLDLPYKGTTAPVSFSLAGWVRFDAPMPAHIQPNGSDFLSSLFPDESNYGWEFYRHWSGSWDGLVTGHDPEGDIGNYVAVPWPSNEWLFWAIAYDADEDVGMAYNPDGSPTPSGPFNNHGNPGPAVFYDTWSGFVPGYAVLGGNVADGDYEMNGAMARLGYLDRALTADEVGALIALGPPA